MIVDPSAILAIAQGESHAEALLQCLEESDRSSMSATSWVELMVVADARGPRVAGLVERLLQDLGIRIEPVTEGHAAAARRAYQDFGRGRHPAGLNFGDCFAYALAKTRNEPLLFVGSDFSQTDVRPALDRS
jgi:ribonuclease VapC